MTENNQKKLDADLVRKLNSSDETTQLKTIQILRAKGNLAYLPHLIRLLCLSGKEMVQKELVRLIADIKQQAVVPMIVDHLNDPGVEGNVSLLVSACWQSGLDFSEDLDLFTRLFLEGDYFTALESFTVIEQSMANLPEGEISRLRTQLLDGINHIREEKKPLARELAYLLENAQ